MKQIINESLQSLQLYFSSPQGMKVYRLQPKQAVVVPTTYIGTQVKNLQKRRMIKVSEYR